MIRETLITLRVRLIIIVAVLCFTHEAGAALRAVGSVDPSNGFPEWYADGNGLALQPCLANDGNCLFLYPAFPGDTFNPEIAPIVFPSNYPFQTIYFIVDALLNVGPNLVLFEIALEGTFPAPPVTPGQQIVLLRTSLDAMLGLDPNTTFTVTHPYGSFQFTTDPFGDTVNMTASQVFVSQEGCTAAPCDFTLPLKSTAKAGPFLEWDRAVPPLPPDGYIGDPLIEHTVTGSPTGKNFVRITGPPGSDVDGFGGNVVTTDLFYVQGKILDLLFAGPASKDFGVLGKGASSPAQTFTVTNTGTGSLAIIAKAVAGANAEDFTLQADSCAPGLVLAPQGSCSVAVLFSPHAEGARKATLDITSKGAVSGKAAPPLVISLTGTADFTPPSVLPATPTNGALKVPVNTQITAVFSEPVDAAAAVAALAVTGPQGPVTGTATYDEAGRMITFKPAADLAFSSPYTASVGGGVIDLAGNPGVSGVTWTFRTAAVPHVTPPAVLSTSPANNETAVTSNKIITVSFSETLDATTITPATFILNGPGGAVAGSVVYDAASSTASFTPSAGLSLGLSYNAKITTGVKDLAGNALAADFGWTFSTLAPVVPPPAVLPSLPEISSVSPPDGPTGVAVNSAVAAVFTKAMEPATINKATFTLRSGASNVSGTVVYSHAARTAFFLPSADLAANTNYTALVTNSVQDDSGNAMAANFTWSFTTAASAINTDPPVVILTGPASGASVMSPDTAVTATFSRPMDAATVSSSSFRLSGMSPVAATVSYDPVTRTAVLTPDSELAAGETFTAVITADVTDAAGVHLQNNYTWTFTVVDSVQEMPLTITIVGSAGGTVTRSDTGDECSSECIHPAPAGLQLILTAEAAKGAKFAGWDAEGCVDTGPCTITVNAPQTVKALFVGEEQSVIRILKKGAGTGSVKVNPLPARTLGKDFYAFPLHSRVKLTAVPDPGVRFAGWSGVKSSPKKTVTIKMDDDNILIAGFGEPRLLLSALELDLGEASKRQPATAPLTIANTGDTALRIKEIRRTGEGASMFSIVDGKTGKPLRKKTIPAGGSLEAEVVFRPKAAGQIAAALSVISDDPHSPVVTVHVRGTGF